MNILLSVEARSESLPICNLDNCCDSQTAVSEPNTSNFVSVSHSPCTLQAVCYKKRHWKEPRKISLELFRKQLQDTSDITAPRVSLQQKEKVIEVTENDVYTFTTVPLNSSNAVQQKLYKRNCITRTEANEIDSSELNLLPLGHKRQINPNTIKRITRKRKAPVTFTNDDTVYFQGTQDHVEYVITNEDVETTDFEDSTQDGEVKSCILIDDSINYNQEIIADQEESTVFIESDADSNLYTCSTSNNMDVVLAATKNDQHLIMFCQDIASSLLPAERLETGICSSSRDYSL